MKIMNLEEIQKKVMPVAERYEVKHLEVFGSYANGTAHQGSDVDFLVEFSIPVPSIFKVMGFREELEKTLGISVDIVTLPLAKPEALFVERSERII